MQVIKEDAETRYGIIGNRILFFENPFLSFAEEDTEENREFMDKLFSGISSGSYNIGALGVKNKAEPMVLTVQEMAELLKISMPMAYRLTRIASFPKLKIGAKTLVPVDMLKKWINTHSLEDEALLGA